jgi:hypothetical protein
MHAPYNRQVFPVIALFLLANAIVIFSASLLPFQDLPNHLAEATIFKLNMQTNDFINSYYTAVPWYFPNTFHPVFCSLFPDVEFGNKVFYFMYTVLLLTSMYLIIKELKGNLWYSLITILFIYNYNVTFGFSGFTIAIPTLLLFFYLLLVDARNDKPVNKIWASIMLVLLFLMHAQVALLALVLYGLMMLYRYWGNFKTLIIRSVLIPLPVILMVFIWWSKRATEKEESTFAFLKDYYTTKYFQTLWERLRIIVFDNFQLREGATGLVIAGLLFSLVFLPLIYFRVWRRKDDANKFKRKEFIYPMIFLFTVVCCYLFLPNSLPGQSPLYERFTTIVILCCIIAGSVLLRDVQTKSLKYYVLAAAILSSALWFEYIYAFNRENSAFRAELFNGLKRNERVGGLIYDNSFRGRMLYLHFPSYYIVWNKGLAASMIIDYRFGVVRRTEKGERIPVFNEWIGNVYREEPHYDTLLEYQLVRGKASVPQDRNLNNFYSVKQAGEWFLFKNKKQIAAAE